MGKDYNVFSLRDITVDNLNKIEIKDVSETQAYGRRFTLDIDDQDLHSAPLVFKDIFAKVKEISTHERKSGNIENLKIATAFLEKLKKIDETANTTYEARAEKETIYKIRTWFHRLFDFGTHSDKIDKECKKNLKLIDPIAYKFSKIENAKDYKRSKLAEKLLYDCLEMKEPVNAEKALAIAFLRSDKRADALNQIMEQYFEKGDSASLVAAFGVISQISSTLAGGPNADTFNRFEHSMRVINGLLEKNTDADLFTAAEKLSNFGWRKVPIQDKEGITTKVVERLIQMAETGDKTGLDYADDIALHSGKWDDFHARIIELR